MPSGEPDRPLSKWSVGFGLVGLIVALGIALSGYAYSITVEARAEALPVVILEIATLCTIGSALVLRDPQGLLRLSNPVLTLLGWMFYYFVKPALAWLQGFRMALESTSTVVLDVDTVVHVQYAHCYFALSLFTIYFLVAPTTVPRPLLRDFPALKVSPWMFILFGLSPYISNVIDRLITTGTIMPSASYGEFIFDEADSISSSRQEGGAGYFVTQVLSKVWYLPIMSLGFGYAVSLSRMLLARRFVRVAAFFLQVPVLLLLGNGGRSYTAFPFLLGFILTDAMIGPLRWIRYVPIAAAAIPAFNLYGVYRGFQHQGPTAAISSSLNELQREVDTVNTEDAVMLTKEAYCDLLTRHGHTPRGFGYFVDSIIQLLPAQIAPEKLQIRATAEFLSDELLGRSRRGGGVAGTIIGDGFLIGGDLGVVVLGVVLGLILGLLVRWGLGGGNGRTTFWRYTLVLMASVQTTQYVRADLGVVLTQILYYVILPATFIRLLTEAGTIDLSLWGREMVAFGRRRRPT